MPTMSNTMASCKKGSIVLPVSGRTATLSTVAVTVALAPA